MSNVEEKAFQVRLPREMWLFLRNKSTEIDKSMNYIIIQLLKKYMENTKKDLK